LYGFGLATVFSLVAAPASWGGATIPQQPAAAGADITETDPAEAAKRESRLITSQPIQFTIEGFRAGEGYFSADGKWLIYQSEHSGENPFYQIYLTNLQDGTTRRVSPGIGKTTCSWVHPDGKRVLFASTHDDPEAVAKQQTELRDRAEGKVKRYAWDYDEHFEIYSIEIDQLGKRDAVYKNLTNSRGYDAEGSYSPDGQLIAFASNRSGFVSGDVDPQLQKKFELDPAIMMDIYIMNADGSDVRRLTDQLGYDGGPFFSPDGRRICWRRFTPDGAIAEVMTMNVDGSDPRQITRMNAMSWAPYYHPSGKYLIFTTNKHGFGNFELYMVAVDGRGEPVRVTYTPGFDGLPVFSPDGQELFWARQTSEVGPSGRAPAQIFRADWNHEGALAALGISDQAEEVDTRSAQAEGSTAQTQTTSEFSPADVARHVAYLCRPELGGRMTGSPGERMATQYVAAYFEHLGLKPGSPDSDWFQEFEFPAGAQLGPDNQMAAADSQGNLTPISLNADWRPVSFSSIGDFDAGQIVFAGYGITAPGDPSNAPYDSYAGLDVRGKWVMVLRFMPEQITPERRQYLASFASLRDKARRARDLGAQGILIVSGPTSRVREQLVPLQRDSTLSGTSIAVVSVTDKVAQGWLSQAGKDLNELQTKLDSGEPSPGFEFPLRIVAKVDVEQVRQIGRNIVARWQVGDQPSPQAIVVGAHIDHLGTGTSSSLAREDEKGQIHFGADDNASGVAVMMEIAEHFATLPPEIKGSLKRDIVFAAWSGEELGLQGSKYFVESLRAAAGGSNSSSLYPGIAAYVNMDMVGRFNKSLALQGLGSSDFWKKEIQRLAIVTKLPVTPIDDTNLPTDATSFYLAGVPIVAAFTGSHNDYHTPRDTPEKLDYERAADIARFMGQMVETLATTEVPPNYVEHKSEARPMARTGARVSLGTIPEYVADVVGVQISGVGKGSPAEAAGLQGGDVIVELAGQKIENIQDYAAVIRVLKPNETVKIAFIREGQRQQAEITPISRD
jgi:Tol biopolymer transport system component